MQVHCCTLRLAAHVRGRGLIGQTTPMQNLQSPHPPESAATLPLPRDFDCVALLLRARQAAAVPTAARHAAR